MYRLKQIDYNGSFEYSEQLAVNLTFVPAEYYVSQNYPNPFNPATTIKYSLPVESMVKINIYNALGEIIEELVSKVQSSGNFEVTWNAQDYSSGIYYYSFEVNSADGSQSHREMKKIVFLK
ncbi:MAG: T9SS type A sorting domain-containing protein [Ignavibacteriaceae bacterium]|nr:T9SS type A sorting domain-containing protein [Ignavibacteriaceae bacterium]